MKIIFLLSLCFLQTFQKEYYEVMDNYESEYPEADAKNNRCFGNTSLSDAQAQCMNNPACLGFSFSRTGSVGGGCFKENTLIGTSSNPSYDGYTKQSTIVRDS